MVERPFGSVCCKNEMLQEMRRRNPAGFERFCCTRRKDGACIDAGESAARLVRKLVHGPWVLRILGYNLLDRNCDRKRARGCAAKPTMATDLTAFRSGGG